MLSSKPSARARAPSTSCAVRSPTNMRGARATAGTGGVHSGASSGASRMSKLEQSKLEQERLDDVRHDEPPGDANAAVRRWAAAFDRAACASPEGSVALYALGNPELLKAATEEVVVWLRDWGLIGRERHVLDLGCGIGRFGAA